MNRIGLSSIVSKYIGETEKNLGRIFAPAEDIGVVLFFDEADALFGKRAEVRDARDLYANIDINNLPQGIEDCLRLLESSFDRSYVRGGTGGGGTSRVRGWANYSRREASDQLRLCAEMNAGVT